MSGRQPEQTDPNEAKRELYGVYYRPQIHAICRRLPIIRHNTRRLVNYHLDGTNPEALIAGNRRHYRREIAIVANEVLGRQAVLATAGMLAGEDGPKIIETLFRYQRHFRWDKHQVELPETVEEVPPYALLSAERLTRLGGSRNTLFALGAANHARLHNLPVYREGRLYSRLRASVGMAAMIAGMHDRQEDLLLTQAVVLKEGATITTDDRTGEIMDGLISLNPDSIRCEGDRGQELFGFTDFPAYPGELPTVTMGCPAAKYMKPFWELNLEVVHRLDPSLFDPHQVT